MNEVMYFVDNNALVQIGAAGRASSFFERRCLIPSDVLAEASGFPEIHSLRRREYKITSGVLICLSEIMSTLTPGDKSLVDLYQNLGRSDPVLIACALYEMEKSAETLFPQDFQIVTDDEAVRVKAEEFGVACVSAREFSGNL